MTTRLSGGVAVATACMVALAIAVTGAVAPAGAAPRAGKSVVGGYVATIAAWPYQAALTTKGRFFCGGTVIAPTKILTAAHCADKFAPSTISVITGRDRLNDTSTGEVLPVVSAAIHPDYPSTRRHDVAVLTLATPTAAPAVRLATREQDALATRPGRLMRLAGFGARHPLGLRPSPVLMEAFSRTRPGARCSKVFRRQYLASAMICTLGSRVWKYKKAPIHSTACFGDSGGPLVTDMFGPAVEVGIASYVTGGICGYKKGATVYSRISDSLDFINVQMAD